MATNLKVEWELQTTPDEKVFIGENDCVVCELNNPKMSFNEKMDNAFLIVNAPKLLRACKSACDYLFAEVDTSMDDKSKMRMLKILSELQFAVTDTGHPLK